MSCPSCGSVSGGDARFCAQCGHALQQGEKEESGSLVSRLAAALAPQIEIVRPIGQGGMGAVYLGRETALDREVAIKVLPLELAGRTELRERFRREAKIAAKLSHPNIVPLYTFGEAGGVLYYVMGFVRGESLAERLERVGAFDPEEARRVLSQLADSLSYAHETGIVHRDIKPENVLLEDRTGRAILTDFGVAKFSDGIDKLTQTGGVLGTPHYMSPEQATGGETDARSDLYSLGVLGYRMLTGRLPIESESLGQLIARHSRDDDESIEPLDASVPSSLASTVMKCLRKAPSDRFGSASEIRDILGIDLTGAELPDELRDIVGRGFWLIPLLFLAGLLTPLEILMWDFIEPGWRTLVLGIQVIPFLGLVMVGGAVASGVEAGLSVRDSIRLVIRAPGWYWGWVPAAMRAPDDLWRRLPATLKQMRVAITVGFPVAIAVIVSIPLTIMAEGIGGLQGWVRPTIRFGAIGMNVVVWALFAFHLRAYRFLKKKGFAAKERSKISTLPSSRARLWRDPKLAALLEEPDIGIRGLRKAHTADEQIDAIRKLMSRIPMPIRVEVERVAERLFGSIQALSRERTALNDARDPEEMQKLETRLAALEASADAPQLSSMRDLLGKQLEVFRDIDSRIQTIDAEMSEARDQLAGLWKAVSAAASFDDPSRFESLRRRIESLAGTASDDEPTTIRGDDEEPTLAR